MSEKRQTVHTEPSNVTSMANYKGKVDETGQSVTVRVPRQSKRKRGWRMHAVMYDIDVSLRMELTGTQRRIVHALASGIPERGGCEARITLTEVGDLLGMRVGNVSRETALLKARHIVRPGRRQGVWEVTPWLLYSGDFASWNAEAEEWPEPIWRRDGVDPATGEVE